MWVGSSAVTAETAFIRVGVPANSAAPDTLELAGLAVGTLSGFGTLVAGFSTITKDAHARWTLTGAISGAGTVTVALAPR